MKRVQASLRPREYRESSFHHCGGTVSLVQACLCDGKTRFNLRGSAGKHDEASVFPKPVYVRERLDNPVLTYDEVL